MGSLMKKAISEQEHRDQEEGFMKKHDNHQESSDSFVVDIESLSSHHHATGTDRDVTANSRITMQRSFSRKGSIRGDRNSITLASPAVADDISNAFTIGGCIAADKSNIAVPLVGVGNAELMQPQPTITITTENRCRRHSKLRPSAWNIDPRRVVLFFATLSSMGTILLIYFTLSISKLSGGDESA